MTERRRAIVTGAARGIGRAVCHTLAARGVDVFATDIDEADLQATIDQAQAGDGPGRVSGLAVDLTATDAADRLYASASAAFGTPDILVSNAGWTTIVPFLSTERDFWTRMIDVNLMAPIALAHVVLSGMVAEGVAEGRVVFVSSDAGRVGSAGEAVYSSAKGGLISLTKSLAREVAKHGITVNCVSPGPIDTRLFRQLSDRRQEALVRGIPLKRIGQPAEVADVVAFFASEGSGYVTGQVLSVSGGLTMS